MSEMRGWSKNSSFSVKGLQTATGSSGRVGNGPMDRACPAKEEVRAPPSEWLAQRPRPVQGFCIEPMQSTADMLRDAFTRLGYFPAVTLIHAAVSSVPGRALFPASTAGAETLGLGSSSESFSEVDVITIDQLVASHNMAAIDVLSIDTEGNDMRVIFGAVHTLAAQKVKYLEFEDHQIFRWANRTYRTLSICWIGLGSIATGRAAKAGKKARRVPGWYPRILANCGD